MARYLLAGASGPIGNGLRESLLRDAHELIRLVRRDPSAPDERRWDPAAGELDAALLDGVDAVVCLSGRNVGDRRWTESFKRELVQSRLDSVGTLARVVAEHGPSTMIVASAVGYYGDTGDRPVDEQSPPGDLFLSRLCEQWEAAADPARDAGARVTHLRTGLVLAKGEGMLGRLVPLVKAGLGGKLGRGGQYMSWISLTDEIAAIRFLLDHDVAGPVNLTAPNPVPNAELTRTLGSVLHRPTIFPAPGFGIRLVLGEFAENVLTGQRVVPTRLLEAGFEFTHTHLEPALRAELGR